MGIVLNQSIRNGLTTVVGFGIGAINTLFLFTHLLEKEYYSLVTYLIAVSNLLWPFIAFGIHNTLIKFFTAYRDREEQDRFLSIMLVVPGVLAAILSILCILFQEPILSYFENDNAIVKPYVWTILILGLSTAYFEIFFAWSKVKLRSVFGNILKEIFVRLCTALLLLLVYFKMITIHQFIYALVGVYVLRLFIMMGYALTLHPIKFTVALPQNYLNVGKYSTLILIAGSVASLLIDLDKVMIERLWFFESVAEYSLAAYIASVIVIPSRAMHQITYPLTAQLLNDKNFVGLKQLYKQSSINLFTISGLLFILIICNVQELYQIIPDEYQLYLWVTLWISFSKLFDNLLGNNNAILYNSPYYRLVLKTGVLMAVLAGVLNYICIPLYGIDGAGFATFTAISVYNGIKLWIVYRKYKMHPFDKNTWLVLVIVTSLSFGFFYWNFDFNPIINIGLKSIVIGIFYLIIIFKLKISNDINLLIKKIPRGA
ncbi:lipopolysaccharide biosynthesis protein [Aquimarina sp. 2-A2]|uniref:lipopolysaccharide biosynthesis protein n=1 Tax=Aquimarina sp. 2-A2 TaxID=3382644 RepID=UPI00387EF7CF